ncbi:uncharacterized protein LOC133907488 [Phragmites australis]|uniref:uncharacterized protein LOC133907488 n=1 Tax=Phragmites australis TaxID=29695 RepID=UPI002D78B523|nr:uncharacterized protein LOC133907488 [Phragmites australis]
MDNVLIDRSTSGLDSRCWTAGEGCRSFNVSLPLPHSSHSSFSYASPLHPFQYAPPYLYSSLPLPPCRPPLLPLPPAATMAKYATSLPASADKPAALRRTGTGEYKRKKPWAPTAGDDPLRAQRRRPLERAAPLPLAPAVDEALDDLEREVARGFVDDLMHALAPPPSSLPLPTFSLVRAAAAKAAAASCAG